jgi:hypothetical protein
MKPFEPGDQVIQRHQRGAVPVLVIAATENPDVVTVWDPATQKYRGILVQGYDLVLPATDVTVREAIDHVLSEAYAVTPGLPR